MPLVAVVRGQLGSKGAWLRDAGLPIRLAFELKKHGRAGGVGSLASGLLAQESIEIRLHQQAPKLAISDRDDSNLPFNRLPVRLWI